MVRISYTEGQTVLLGSFVGTAGEVVRNFCPEINRPKEELTRFVAPQKDPEALA
jgi:hypothetical protein